MLSVRCLYQRIQDLVAVVLLTSCVIGFLYITFLLDGISATNATVDVKAITSRGKMFIICLAVVMCAAWGTAASLSEGDYILWDVGNIVLAVASAVGLPSAKWAAEFAGTLRQSVESQKNTTSVALININKRIAILATKIELMGTAVLVAGPSAACTFLAIVVVQTVMNHQMPYFFVVYLGPMIGLQVCSPGQLSRAGGPCDDFDTSSLHS
jgi:hypothetical protein